MFAKVKHHLMAIGTPVALKLRDAFIKRIKERHNHTLIHLMYFLRVPNYWNFEKDRFDVPIVKEDIIKLATSLICRLFPNDVRNPTLENDSQDNFFESSEKDSVPNSNDLISFFFNSINDHLTISLYVNILLFSSRTSIPKVFFEIF